MLEVVDAPRARVHRRATRRSSPSSRQLASVAIANAQLYERERTIARTLQRSLRPGRAARRCPACRPPCASAPPARAIELGGDFYDLFRGRRRRLGGADRRRPGQGPGRRRGDRARPPHAARRRRLRAPPERRADAAAPRAARAAAPTAASAPSPTPTCGSAATTSRLELACGGHPLPLVVHPDGRVEPVGRLGTLLGSDIEPLLDRRRRRARARATCSCSTPTASPRSGGAAARCSATASWWSCCRRAAGCRRTRWPIASRRPCWPPRRAGCATTWRSWPSGPTPDAPPHPKESDG